MQRGHQMGNAGMQRCCRGASARRVQQGRTLRQQPGMGDWRMQGCQRPPAWTGAACLVSSCLQRLPTTCTMHRHVAAFPRGACLGTYQGNRKGHMLLAARRCHPPVETPPEVPHNQSCGGQPRKGLTAGADLEATCQQNAVCPKEAQRCGQDCYKVGWMAQKTHLAHTAKVCTD